MKFVIYITIGFLVTYTAICGQVIDDYYVFNDSRDGQKFIKKLYPESNINHIEKKGNESTFTKVSGVITELTQLYRRKYLEKNIPDIHFSIVSNGAFTTTAMVYYIDREARRYRTSNFMVIEDKYASGNLEQLYGVIAHELGHFIRNHGNDSFDNKYDDIIYYAYDNTADNCVACMVNFDEEGNELTKNVYELIDKISDHSSYYDVNTYEIPFTRFKNHEEKLVEILLEMLDKTPNDSKCQDAKKSYKLLQSSIEIYDVKGVGLSNSKLDMAFKYTAEEFKKNAGICFDGKRELFFNVLAKVLGNNGDEWLSKIASWQDHKKFSEYTEGMNSMQTELYQMLRDETDVYKIMEHMYKVGRLSIEEASKKIGFDIKNLRIVTQEDEADMEAISILKNTKYPFAFSKLAYFELKPNEKILCNNKEQKGEEVYYGSLHDPHHDICWRYIRSRKLEKSYTAHNSGI